MERKRSSARSIPNQTIAINRNKEEEEDNDAVKKSKRSILMNCSLNTTKLAVLLILCLQNSVFTILRRYSQGVLKEIYSKVSLLLDVIVEIVKK